MWSHARHDNPVISYPIQYGWREEDNKYYFQWFEGDQLPFIQMITDGIYQEENIIGTIKLPPDTKYVGRTYGQEKEELEAMAANFVNSVKAYMEVCGTENCGFHLQLYSNRTLSYVGSKVVACAVYSVSSTTQSCTTLPIISARGKLV
ncbi:hypothetical protein QE152_g37133 [Popillia japonica]|uniref:Uncharacterized protein n=1 Tax=Popillia japonica TaxID=7064 RepID=A0AAW1IAT0_POPJA